MPRSTKTGAAAARKPNGTGHTDDEMLLGESIGYQLRKTHRLMEADLQARLLPHDIPVGMWYFLRILWIEDGLTQRDLSRRVGATEPSTLEQLRNMEQRGVVERRRSEQDRRKTLVFLTASGRRLRRELLPYVMQTRSTALHGFGARETEQLTSLLRRVRENIRRFGKT